MWCWRRLLTVPWTERRSNQSILKEINPECSLEGLMLKLKLQYLATWCEELTHWKRPWYWERLRAGGEGDDRWWDVWMTLRVKHDWATELNWTELNFEKIEHQGSFSICLGVHDYKQRHCNSETIQLSSIALRSTDTKTFTGYQQTESCKR